MNTEQPRRGFEDRLLDELRSLVVAQPSSGPEPHRRRRLSWVASVPRRRLALVGSVAAVLAVAAAAGIPFLTSGAAPAYAVRTNDDGTVTVEISSLSDAGGLQSKLRDAGVRAVVQYLPAGKACKEPWFTLAWPQDKKSALEEANKNGEPAIKGGVSHTSDGHTRFTISRTLPADETLVIMTRTTGAAGEAGAESVGIALAKGEVMPCEIVDAPAGSQPFSPPPPGAGKLHTETEAPGAGPSTSSAG